MRLSAPHVSYFVRNQDTPASMTHALSGAVSEWLFASGFWSGVNGRLGTIFDQFEEDTASGKTLDLIITAIEEVSGSLSRRDEREIEFEFRYHEDGRVESLSMPIILAVEELRALTKFLGQAATHQEPVGLCL